MDTYRDYVQNLGVIRIKTKELSLELDDPYYSRHRRIPSTPYSVMEQLIMSKMTIVPAANKAACERWERFTYDPNDKTKTPVEQFEAWPVGPMDNPGLGRMTRKVVQI
jgi:hypothetical protein